MRDVFVLFVNLVFLDDIETRMSLMKSGAEAGARVTILLSARPCVSHDQRTCVCERERKVEKFTSN